MTEQMFNKLLFRKTYRQYITELRNPKFTISCYRVLNEAYPQHVQDWQEKVMSSNKYSKYRDELVNMLYKL